MVVPASRVRWLLWEWVQSLEFLNWIELALRVSRKKAHPYWHLICCTFQSIKDAHVWFNQVGLHNSLWSTLSRSYDKLALRLFQHQRKILDRLMRWSNTYRRKKQNALCTLIFLGARRAKCFVECDHDCFFWGTSKLLVNRGLISGYRREKDMIMLERW